MIPAAHQKFVDQAKAQLSQDARILGLAATGSWIRGALDQFSDLNLLVVSEAPIALREEMQEVALRLGTCLASFTGEHRNAPEILTCLFEGPLLHVDLKFIALKELEERSENPAILWEREGALTRTLETSKPRSSAHSLQWMEDRFWAWLHYASQRLGRGEIFEALDMLALLRSQVLGPLIMIKSQQIPCGVHRLERFAGESEIEALRCTVSSYDAARCEQALKAAAKLYLDLRETLAPADLQRNRRAEMASVRYLHEVGEIVRDSTRQNTTAAHA